MDKIIKIFIFLWFVPATLLAQNSVESVVSQIEKNNTTLSALRKSVEAEKIGNKTGIYLQDPEVTFNYMWGNPAVIGNRTDFSISQTFDFPTAYAYKNQISNIKNERVELEYQKQRKNVILESRRVCYGLVYFNALASELSKRFDNAQSIANSYKAKFDIGEISVLEYNKSQLNLLSIVKELESLMIERKALLSELTRLNGGVYIDFTEKEALMPKISENFEQWYLQAELNNPILSWLKKEILMNQQQMSLNRAMSLPKIKVGYMSEKVVGQKYQGVTLGLSIPLWENKNTVKYAKTNIIAIESIVADNKLQFYNQLKILHSKAIGLTKTVTDYRLSLLSLDNSILLKKALDKGEITILDYILETSIYFESIKKILEMERELSYTFAEMNQYF
ncbi:MAG: TolC family protein [Bacteroidales bacterium]|jgi:hypothetical protein